jgi:hypothetical protein
MPSRRRGLLTAARNTIDCCDHYNFPWLNLSASPAYDARVGWRERSPCGAPICSVLRARVSCRRFSAASDYVTAAGSRPGSVPTRGVLCGKPQQLAETRPAGQQSSARLSLLMLSCWLSAAASRRSGRDGPPAHSHKSPSVSRYRNRTRSSPEPTISERPMKRTESPRKRTTASAGDEASACWKMPGLGRVSQSKSLGAWASILGAQASVAFPALARTQLTSHLGGAACPT